MSPTPERPKARGSMVPLVPLSGLQLLCCAAVVGLGVHMTARLFHRADTTTQSALAAFEVAAQAQAAADAALARLSEIKVVVQRNDTLDAIFRRLQFSLVDLANIRSLEVARKGLDILRPGDELTLVTRDGELVALQRPLSLDQTLKVERDPAAGFVASTESVPLVRHVHGAGGVIEQGSSLSSVGSAAGLRATTIDELEKMFGWDINFGLDLRQGDTFTLVYEQLERDGRIVADGRILAAEFVNDGRRIRAVRFERPDGKAEYYTPEGASMRKAFLKAPLQFSRISSNFNPRRKHPVLNTIRAHRGVDYAAPTGTPVHAVSAGRIQFRGVKGGFGNVVEIAHNGKVVTRYGHLSRFAKGLANGQRVEQGELIAYVGSTGLATGPHLHFEYIEAGVYKDPQKAIKRGEPGPPLADSERPAFEAQVAPLLARLESISMPVSATLAAK